MCETMSSILNTAIPAQVAKNVDIQIQSKPCAVCLEPSAGFHFGAFTCEGCKSFFGRTYNNVSALGECKNNGNCVINKKNRTSCKSCRLKKCIFVGMSKSGSRYGRRSNWFKIHCLIQDQVEMSGRLSSDNQTLLSLGSNENQNNSNNTGSAACTPSPSGANSNNSSQNNGAINSSNNGSDLLSQYKTSLKETELNTSSNSSKLVGGKGHAATQSQQYNALLQEMAKSGQFKLTGQQKQNGSSNSINNGYPQDTQTPPLQTKLNNKFNRNLNHHQLPLSPISPLLNPLFQRNLLQQNNSSIASTSAAAQLLSQNNQINSSLSNQSLLNNAIQNNLYQNYAAQLLPLQPLLQNQNNSLASANNLLNSLTGARNNSTPQQLFQQQLFELAGLNKLFAANEKSNSKKNTNQADQQAAIGTFNDQETPIDLSVTHKHAGLDATILQQVCANYGLLNNLDDQSTFSPSSSNEENCLGLPGGLPIDPSTLAAIVQLNNSKNLLNNLNNLNSLNSLNNLTNLTNSSSGLAGLDQTLNNLNDLNAMNSLLSNLTQNNTHANETKDDTFDNHSDDNTEDNTLDDDSINSKLNKQLQNTLNQFNNLNSAKSLLALTQLNPNLLSNTSDLGSLLGLTNNQQLLVNHLKQQQQQQANKMNQSLDLLRNVQKQQAALNKSTSINQQTSSNKRKLTASQSTSSSKQIDLVKSQLLTNTKPHHPNHKEPVPKDKNNNEDEKLNDTDSNEQEIDDEQINDEASKSELDTGLVEDEQETVDSKAFEEDDKQRETRKHNDDQDGEDELSDDQLSDKSNQNKRKRKKRSSATQSSKTSSSAEDGYENEPEDDDVEETKEIKRMKKDDSEQQTAEELIAQE